MEVTAVEEEVEELVHMFSKQNKCLVGLMVVEGEGELVNIFHKHNKRFKVEEGELVDLYRILLGKWLVVEGDVKLMMSQRIIIQYANGAMTNSMILKIVLGDFDIQGKQNTKNLNVDNVGCGMMNLNMVANRDHKSFRILGHLLYRGIMVNLDNNLDNKGFLIRGHLLFLKITVNLLLKGTCNLRLRHLPLAHNIMVHHHMETTPLIHIDQQWAQVLGSINWNWIVDYLAITVLLQADKFLYLDLL
jgi:hypothetical protein